MNPKISVLTTVYNGERFLKETIESVLNQTFKNFEYIIVNDGSTDNTKKIIKEYMNKDNRIVYLENEINKGFDNLHNILNMGLKIAKGKYAAILDGDDISHSQRLEKQFNYLESNLHIFLVGSSAIYIDEKGTEIRRFRKYNNYKMIAWRLLKSCCIVHSSIMFKNQNRRYDNYFKRVEGLHDGSSEVIYVPTEANIPILEATRFYGMSS